MENEIFEAFVVIDGNVIMNDDEYPQLDELKNCSIENTL